VVTNSLEAEKVTFGRALLPVLLILFMPMQKFPVLLDLFGKISFLDEVSIVAGILLIPIIIRSATSKVEMIDWFMLGLMVIYIAYSSIVFSLKGVGYSQGFFGLFDHLKIFLIYLFFRLVRLDAVQLELLMRKLVIVGLILAVVGLSGEILAKATGWGVGLLVAPQQRHGLYRVISMSGMGSWNHLGILSVLILFLAYSVYQKERMKMVVICGLIFALVIMTFSRQAWLCLLIMLMFRTRMGIAKVSVLLVGVLGVAIFWDAIAAKLFSDAATVTDAGKYFRLYAFEEGVRIFSENVYFGSGSGTYGGLASVLFNSSHYDHWSVFFREEFLYKARSIDQYWIGILAEMGSVGFLLYMFMFLRCYKAMNSAIKRFQSNCPGRQRNIEYGKVLKAFMLPLFVVGFMNGINASMISFVYFGIMGIYIGASYETTMTRSNNYGGMEA